MSRPREDDGDFSELVGFACQRGGGGCEPIRLRQQPEFRFLKAAGAFLAGRPVSKARLARWFLQWASREGMERDAVSVHALLGLMHTLKLLGRPPRGLVLEDG